MPVRLIFATNESFNTNMEIRAIDNYPGFHSFSIFDIIRQILNKILKLYNRG